jgi:multidrug efflux pump
MHVRVAYDSTEYIQDALHEVIRTLVETLVIVVAVIFLFLGSWRSIVIPVIAIPISLVGAAFLMLLFGFSEVRRNAGPDSGLHEPRHRRRDSDRESP